jgi:hypothetical protein
MADSLATEFRKNGKVILEIPVMHRGWEMDSMAWIIEYKGEVALITTNHGGCYFGDESFLREKLAEYAEAMAASRKAIKLLAARPVA